MAATAKVLTYTQMKDWLQILLNQLNQADSEPFEFTPASTDLMINTAQNKVAELLDKGLLPELETSDLSKALDASGNYDTASLTAIVYDSPLGIDRIRISSGKFCEITTFDEYTDMVNIDHTFVVTAPYAYLYGGTIHIEPNSGIATSIDVYYRKEPTDISSSANCAFNIKICETIVHYAASIGFEWGKDLERSERERSLAFDEIAQMNKNYYDKIGVTEETNVDLTE